LAQPSNALSVSLPHDNTAHEHLDWSNALKWHLAFAGRMVQAKCGAQLVFTDGVGVIDLVTEDDEWSGFELFQGEQGIELGLGLVETLVILRIDEEDDTTDFWDSRAVSLGQGGGALDDDN